MLIYTMCFNRLHLLPFLDAQFNLILDQWEHLLNGPCVLLTQLIRLPFLLSDITQYLRLTWDVSCYRSGTSHPSPPGALVPSSWGWELHITNPVLFIVF